MHKFDQLFEEMLFARRKKIVHHIYAAIIEQLEIGSKVTSLLLLWQQWRLKMAEILAFNVLYVKTITFWVNS